MVTVIKKGTPKTRIREKLKSLKSSRSKGLQTGKYHGKLKSKVDPLAYQRASRDEWK